MSVWVMRVECLPEPYVPSVKVACERCGQACWLSRSTGGDMVKVAELIGAPGFECMDCAGFCSSEVHDS